MLRWIFLFLLVSSVTFGQAIQYHQENYPDGKLKKEWYSKGKDTVQFWKGYRYSNNYQTENYTKIYTESGTITKEYWTLNNLKHGYSKQYHNGFLVVEGNYVKGQRSGFWKFYSEQKLDSTGSYRNNIPTNKWSYYKNGKLHYTKDKNSYQYFYTNGKLKTCGNLIQEKKEGYWKTYSDNGSLNSEGFFLNDVKHGFWKLFHSNGTLKEAGNYTHGQKSGYWHIYNNQGSLTESGHYEGDKKSKWWSFFNGGKLVHKCQLKADKKDGYCLVYKAGKLNKAIKFERGTKVGEWTDLASFKRENNLNDLR